MFKRLITGAVLFGMAATAPPALALQPSCALRDTVVERLKSKYSEVLTAGGLQGVASDKTTFVEVWASDETGTFTVILTNPQGLSCVVAAGTDWFQKNTSEDVTPESDEVPL